MSILASESEVAYLKDTNDSQKNYSRDYRFSPMELKGHDPVRHIPLEDAFKLIGEQRDRKLSIDRLTQAINNNDVRVYEFKGESFLDRLDIGRVYHDRKETREGLKVDRYFSKERENPYESIGEYHEVNLEIPGTDFKMTGYFPKSWENQTSNNIVANKYFFKPKKEEWKEKLKDKIGTEYENSPRHLIERVTNFIADEGYRLGYFKTEEDKNRFADELKWLQINQRFAFNSPVQFNAGLNNEYGIVGSNGINYSRDPKTGEVSKIEEGDYLKPQCHACFIKGPQDNLESILKHFIDEGAIFSSGSGIGQNMGTLRAEGEPLSGGGEASGPLSFMKVYDDGAATIKSGGKSRRAAKMVTMWFEHPDILKFIRGKVREDKKALDLMKLGYEPGMDGEAVRTVTFQNTNHSVRISDDFFEQVENNGNIQLKRVTDGKVTQEISARQMLQEIAFGSWRIGDPAVQYDTKIHEMHPCKNSGKQQSTNPCSEYLFLNDTACNLLSHNLCAYSDDQGTFHVEEFQRGVRLSTIAADIINDAASYPVEDIAMISPEFRTTGIGYANLGALLMRKGLAYDSEEGRAFTGAVTSLMTGTAFETSIEMAEKLETFVHFEFNRNPFLDVMKKHRKNLEDVLWDRVPEDLKQASYESWDNVVNKGENFGFRNAQTTVLAPTGTISYLMHADTTGIEPGIALTIPKELAGGGHVQLVNKEIPNALKNLGYDKEQVKDIGDYIEKELPDGRPINSIIGAPHLNPNHYNVFDTAFGDGRGNGTIDFEGHVKILAAAQPFISGAISKTCNLPESASVKDIYDSFLLAHDLDLKALAVFRDESKPTAALKFFDKGFKELKRGEKEDMPNRRDAFETEVNIRDIKFGNTPLHVIVSEYEDGRPGQITFLSYTAGSDIGALLSTHGISASKSLKRGVSLEDVTEGWIGQEFNPKGFVSGHPYIKSALSPLDLGAKLLRLEYLGDLDVLPHEIKKEVDITTLRGFKNGAFRTYNREKVDDWDFEQVINDPEYGGFTNNSNSPIISIKENNHFSNSRGVTCTGCGNIMNQTSPNCFSCGNCGEKMGGCGM